LLIGLNDTYDTRRVEIKVVFSCRTIILEERIFMLNLHDSWFSLKFAGMPYMALGNYSSKGMETSYLLDKIQM